MNYEVRVLRRYESTVSVSAVNEEEAIKAALLRKEGPGRQKGKLVEAMAQITKQKKAG